MLGENLKILSRAMERYYSRHWVIGEYGFPQKITHEYMMSLVRDDVNGLFWMDGGEVVNWQSISEFEISYIIFLRLHFL